MILLCKKFIVEKSKDVKAGSKLAESSVLPMTMMME
jgi:hypothetical protein